MLNYSYVFTMYRCEIPCTEITNDCDDSTAQMDYIYFGSHGWADS